jgi:hypothetical protein
VGGGTYQTVINEDFSPPPAVPPVTINCDAAIRNARLELTEPAGNLVGSAFFNQARPNDDFMAEFDFTFPEASAPGADGLAFIMNTGGPLDIGGVGGGALGFKTGDVSGASVFPGFAVVFDTWQNEGEPSHNWVGFINLQLGTAPQVAADVPEEFCNNATFHATIVGSQGTFVVLLENTSIGMERRQILGAALDSFTPAPTNFGFTAGTGGAWARHAVDNFRLGLLTAPPQGNFIRGDANGNLVIDLSDAVFELLFSFNGTVTSNCQDAMDADDNGRLEVTDALRILRYLFQGGPAPAAPFPTAGTDTTPDTLPACLRGL